MLQVFIGFIVLVFLALFVMMSLPMVRDQNQQGKKNQSNHRAE
jgi:hypothetical protein